MDRGVATEQLGESAVQDRRRAERDLRQAAELIITIFAIRAGEIAVAKASITGSILGNTLLVLGLSFLVGGFRNGLQTFNQRVAGMNASMLALAVIGLGIPTLFDRVGSHARRAVVERCDRRILLSLYVLMLIFFFRTPEVSREGVEKHAVAHWSARLAMLLLLLSTGAVAVIADVFVGTLSKVIADLGISAVFLGLIIVPLVGNIAENIVGIKIAYENDMDFSMLVSLGSSLQIALGVAPLLVFISLLIPTASTWCSSRSRSSRWCRRCSSPP